MGLYNFQTRFVPFILSGAKTHTIRATRAFSDKPGSLLHLYTGLRTKKAKLLMRVPCVKVEEIVIGNGFGHGSVFINGAELSESDREQLARRDGFPDFASMLQFWEKPKDRLPFRGQIVHWDPGVRKRRNVRGR